MRLLKKIIQAPFLLYKIQHRLINAWLSHQFLNAVTSGDMEFFRGRFLFIHVDDIDVNLSLTLGKHGPIVISGDVIPDATISGPLESFLLLAEQTVDADTLFFQRKLSVEGDTEFALEVKNLLYRIEWLPESKSLAQKLHAMQQAFNRLPTFLLSQTKSH